MTVKPADSHVFVLNPANDRFEPVQEGNRYCFPDAEPAKNSEVEAKAKKLLDKMGKPSAREVCYVFRNQAGAEKPLTDKQIKLLEKTIQHSIFTSQAAIQLKGRVDVLCEDCKNDRRVDLRTQVDSSGITVSMDDLNDIRGRTVTYSRRAFDDDVFKKQVVDLFTSVKALKPLKDKIRSIRYETTDTGFRLHLNFK